MCSSDLEQLQEFCRELFDLFGDAAHLDGSDGDAGSDPRAA